MSDQVVNVSIETWGEGADTVDGNLLGDLVEALVDLGAHGPSTSAGGIAGGPGATFSVPKESTPTAAAAASTEIRHAVGIFEKACARIGLRHRGIARVDLMDDRYLDSWLNQEPETFLGVSEVAEMLGVSKQRVSELRRTRSDFPEPVAELASGPVWAISSLRRFLDEWPRRAGRPASWEARLNEVLADHGAPEERIHTLLLDGLLSEREVLILGKIAAGESVSAVAADLDISREAIRSALRRVLNKLQTTASEAGRLIEQG